ncbi:unnamed protein product [Phytophthora fragariaefolia]|uniref:Unnamed protein product n=1 Tax=Phytophthora fragariaefolia TaxID=1490495 RepID=A0A9W6Y8H9_9STRA|nr:unnamed protein product [Phytophthora fragariaefolia]
MNVWFRTQNHCTRRKAEKTSIDYPRTGMVAKAGYKWVLISMDTSEIDMELFLDRQKLWKKKISQHEPCQVCRVLSTEHTMHYTIYQCNSPSCAECSDPCHWFMRTTPCDINKRGKIEQHGRYISSAFDTRGRKLNLQMKRFIREKVKAKFKPSRILNAIFDARMFDIETEAFYPRLPDNAAFGFAFPTNETGQPTLSRGTAAMPVIVGFTTKTMIRNLAYAKEPILHVDAIFKLNTASFPLVIIGVSDVRRQKATEFHPVAFFIVSDIRQPQLEKVFHETFKMYQSLTGRVAVIRYVMADADVAQRNALEVVINQALMQTVPPVYLMCVFHVMQNVRKYAASIPPALRTKTPRQVYHIHYTRSEDDLDRRCCVTPPGYANTNNPVEQFNKEINRDYSLRSLLSFNSLVKVLLDSHHRSCRAKSFDITPIPSKVQAARFRRLQKEGRISVTSHHRASIASLMDGKEKQVVRVFQGGADVARISRKKPLTTKEELDQVDEEVAIEEQPVSGWLVDVNGSFCPCRTILKRILRPPYCRTTPPGASR